MNELQQLRQDLANALGVLQALLETPEEKLDNQDKKDLFDQQLSDAQASVDGLRRKVRAAEAAEEALALEDQARAATAPGQARAEFREQLDDHGWSSFGEFSQAVIEAGAPGGSRAYDDRLRFMADAPGSTTVNSGSGAAGGFLVPPAFSNRVREYAFGEDAFLPLTASDPIDGNSMSFPRDETTPWGNSGVLAYWDGEGQLLSKSALVNDLETMTLKKLTCLVPVTNEMLQDAALLNSRLPRHMGRAVAWKSNDAIMNGTGSGIPLGIQNALNTALVTQAKVGSQAADTIVAQNIAQMYARNTNPGGADWTINPDAWNQLPLLTIGDMPMWTPTAAGLRAPPGGLLLGRPVHMSDTMQTLGDAGDIGFIDFQAYETITKAGGMSFATSMHLWFDYDMTAFRLIFRMDGAPAFRTAVTPPNSSVTRSPYIILAARA